MARAHDESTAGELQSKAEHGVAPIEGLRPQTRLEHLQRTAGNRAVARMVAPASRLEVGAADDPFEREADSVAERVVRALQRTADAPAGAATSTVAGRVQRRADGVVGLEGGPVDEGFERSLSSARSGGSALAEPVRRSMEDAFGADFSGVKVHDGSQSTQLNESISAKAFTVGSDIFFRDGTPDTGSPAGQKLLAHELTHVVQQGGAASRTVNRPVVDGPRVESGTYEPELDRRAMRPGRNPRVDRGDPSATKQLQAETERENREEAAEGRKGEGARSKGRRKAPDNENYRGGIGGLPARIAYGVKATVKTLPDCAVKRVVPAGPNGTAHIDPTDYGICDTEDIGDNEIKVTAVHEGGEWHAEVLKIVAPYSKIIQLPAGVHEVTGPGGGGPGETTLANSREQIKCLLATFGPPYYMNAAVDGHESVHETRLLPALRAIAPEVQRTFSQLTVPYEGDALALAAEQVRPGGPTKFGDKASALAAIQALPAYAAAVDSILQLFDVKYDELIADDHQGKAQKGEEKATRPMIAKINKFRVKNGKKAIPVKYTWTPY